MEGYLNKHTSSVLGKWKSRYFRLQYVFVPDHSEHNRDSGSGPLSSPSSVPQESAPHIPPRRNSVGGGKPPLVPPRVPARSKSRPAPPIPSHAGTRSVVGGVVGATPLPPEKPRPSFPSRSRAGSFSISRSSGASRFAEPEVLGPKMDVLDEEVGHYVYMFTYYTDKQCLVPKYAVQLSSLILAKPSKLVKEAYTFQLDFENRTFLLQANSDVEMHGWLIGLLDAARQECDILGIPYHGTEKLFLRDNDVITTDLDVGSQISLSSKQLQESRIGQSVTGAKTRVVRRSEDNLVKRDKNRDPMIFSPSSTSNNSNSTSNNSNSTSNNSNSTSNNNNSNNSNSNNNSKKPMLPSRTRTEIPPHRVVGDVVIPLLQYDQIDLEEEHQTKPQEYRGLGSQYTNSNISATSTLSNSSVTRPMTHSGKLTPRREQQSNNREFTKQTPSEELELYKLREMYQHMSPKQQQPQPQQQQQQQQQYNRRLPSVSPRTIQAVVPSSIPEEQEQHLDVSLGDQSEEMKEQVNLPQPAIRRNSVASVIQQAHPSSTSTSGNDNSNSTQNKQPSVMFQTPVKQNDKGMTTNTTEVIQPMQVMDSPGLDTSNQYISYNNMHNPPTTNRNNNSILNSITNTNNSNANSMSIVITPTATIPIIQKPMNTSAMSSSYYDEKPLMNMTQHSSSPLSASHGSAQGVSMKPIKSLTPSISPRNREQDNPPFTLTLDDDDPDDEYQMIKPHMMQQPSNHKKNQSASDWDFELSLDDPIVRKHTPPDSLERMKQQSTRKPASNNISKLAGSFLSKDPVTSPNKTYLSVYDKKASNNNNSFYF